MTSIAVAAALLLGAMVVPAVALVGLDIRALAFGAVLTGVVAGCAGTLSLATEIPTTTLFIIGVVTANVAAGRHLVTRRPQRADTGRLVAAAVVCVVSAYPLLGLESPDAGWDARAIWFLHARWFFAGGASLRWAVRNPAYAFAHPDYPPLIGATVGSFWGLVGHVDLRMGQAAVTMLNVAAVALLGTGLLRLRANRAVGCCVGAALCLAAYGFTGVYSTNGYADLLWAACAAAAMLHLLLLPPDRADLAIGLACAVGAALTKNEGIPVAAVILLLAAVRHRGWCRAHIRSASGVALLVGLAASVVAWPGVASLVHVRSDLLGGARSGGPLAVKHNTWARVQPAWHAIWVWCRAGIRLAALLTVIGALALLRRRRALGMGSSVWSWLVVAGSLGSLVAAYALSPYDLAWHLGTSLDRTSIAPRLLVTTETACWVVCALAALLPGGVRHVEDLERTANEWKTMLRGQIGEIGQEWQIAERRAPIAVSQSPVDGA